jgi:hypothetical protein
VSPFSFTAIGAPRAPAIAAMASILFRMLYSFVIAARRLAAGLQSHPIHRVRHCSGNNGFVPAAILSIFPLRWNPLRRQASPIVEPRKRVKSRSRFDISPKTPSRRDFK